MIILALGSNIGDKNHHLYTASLRLEGAGILIDDISFHYENPPWHFEAAEDFINIVLKIGHTVYSPIQLLRLVQAIEFQVGRRQKKTSEYQSRCIDIDIIAYHDLVINTSDLVLPHPHMHKRDFVLRPLCSVASNWVHPIFCKTASQLLTDLIG